MAIRTIVWGENIHEQTNEIVRSIYPNGMHNTIADALNRDGGLSATTATLQEPEHGLPAARLAETDVLLWWGHKDHGAVDDAFVDLKAGVPVMRASLIGQVHDLRDTTMVIEFNDEEALALWDAIVDSIRLRPGAA